MLASGDESISGIHFFEASTLLFLSLNARKNFNVFFSDRLIVGGRGEVFPTY